MIKSLLGIALTGLCVFPSAKADSIRIYKMAVSGPITSASALGHMLDETRNAAVVVYAAPLAKDGTFVIDQIGHTFVSPDPDPDIDHQEPRKPGQKLSGKITTTKGRQRLKIRFDECTITSYVMAKDHLYPRLSASGLELITNFDDEQWAVADTRNEQHEEGTVFLVQRLKN